MMAIWMGQTTLKQLGQYEILEVLGHGGMSTVYRARQTSMGREVAIKVLSANLVHEIDFMERFTQEVKLISKLEHPHILPVIDYGESDNNAYLVMRLVTGGSLADRIKLGPFTLEAANKVLREIAPALDYAHRQGVIHRDLKPSNILLDREGNCYLTDFGIAKIMHEDQSITTTGHVMGTPAYMSPEQGLGLPIDGRADQYAMGLIVYEMLAARRPFTADTPSAHIFQHVYQPPPRLTVLNPDLPQVVEDVVLKALAKRPEDRYVTLVEFADAFDSAIRGMATQVTQVSRRVAASTAPTLVNPALTPDMTTLTMSTTERELPKLPAVPPPEAPAEEPSVTAPSRPRRRWSLAAFGVAVMALVVAGALLLGPLAATSEIAAMTSATATPSATATLALTTVPAAVVSATSAVGQPTRATASPSPSSTPTLTATPAPTETLTHTPTPTQTASPTRTPTSTATTPPSATLPPTATVPPSATLAPGAVATFEFVPEKEIAVRKARSAEAEVLAVVIGQRVFAVGRDAAGEWVQVRVVATGRLGWVSAGELNLPPETLLSLPVSPP